MKKQLLLLLLLLTCVATYATDAFVAFAPEGITLEYDINLETATEATVIVRLSPTLNFNDLGGWKPSSLGAPETLSSPGDMQ